MGFELLSFRIRFSKRSKKVEWAKNRQNGDWKGFSGQAAGNRRWRSAEKKHKKTAVFCPSLSPTQLHCNYELRRLLLFLPPSTVVLPEQWRTGHLLNGPRPKRKEVRRKEASPLLQMTSAASHDSQSKGKTERFVSYSGKEVNMIPT